MSALCRAVPAVVVTLTWLALAATPAIAGPPWISVEYPSNPHHPATRDATFLVRAYHHDSALNVPITASLEGLVDGRRRTVAAHVKPTHVPGVYAVHAVAPADGAWLVVVTLTQSPTASATALVTLRGDGGIAAVRVPSERSRDGWVIPKAVGTAEVDAELREAERIAAAEAAGASRAAGTTALGLATFGLLLAFGVRRGRRLS